MIGASPGAPILLVGANGQLGQALRPLLGALGSVVACGRRELDLENPAQLRDVVRTVRPRIVVNAAAYTAVDAAEREAERCRRVNAIAPEELASEAARVGAPIVHFSTNFVFDGGSSEPYCEDDPMAPLSVYGRSKAEGEARLAAANPAHVIVRTSALYSRDGVSFVRRIMELARERAELRIVGDQFVSPTPVDLVAQGTLAIVQRLLDADSATDSGGSATALANLYHLTTTGTVSWCAFAKRILALDPRRDEHRAATVEEISSDEFAAPARRPRNGVLDNSRFARFIGSEIPAWDVELERYYW